MLNLVADQGMFLPERIAGALRTTKEEVAQSAGLGRDAVLRQDRVTSVKTQKRLRGMVGNPEPDRAAFWLGADGLCLVSVTAAVGVFGPDRDATDGLGPRGRGDGLYRRGGCRGACLSALSGPALSLPEPDFRR